MTNINSMENHRFIKFCASRQVNMILHMLSFYNAETCDAFSRKQIKPFVTAPYEPKIKGAQTPVPVLKKDSKYQW